METNVMVMVNEALVLYKGSEETIIRLGKKWFDKGLVNSQFAALIIDVDNNKELVEIIMPNSEATWETFRRNKQKPIARGIMSIDFCNVLVTSIDGEEVKTKWKEPLKGPSSIKVIIIGKERVYITDIDVNAPKLVVIGAIVEMD